MLHRVEVGTQSIAVYASSAGAARVEELRALAEPLRGARVLHLNATPHGGGVAGILRSEVPLLRNLGLAAEWQLITGDDAFFSVTKAIHNAIQGANRSLSPVEQEAYLANAMRNAHAASMQVPVSIADAPVLNALLQKVCIRHEEMFHVGLDTGVLLGSDIAPDESCRLSEILSPVGAQRSHASVLVDADTGGGSGVETS